ncbi:MAG: hypothetical protein AVDCRST_MAG83-3560, partial [uncultured Arthrobacter sp.]
HHGGDPARAPPPRRGRLGDGPGHHRRRDRHHGRSPRVLHPGLLLRSGRPRQGRHRRREGPHRRPLGPPGRPRRPQPGPGGRHREGHGQLDAPVLQPHAGDHRDRRRRL